jgi:RNA polymerase sigma-70 factor, ECF subfamily
MQTGEATCNSAGPDLGLLMSRYQQADSAAAASLVELLSPRLYRFLAGQMGSQIGAEDMLQDVWLRIHRVRHTYRPGESLLPWVYAIARCVRVDSYRRRRRIESHESAVAEVPEPPARATARKTEAAAFEDLVAALPESQREVLTMLKVNGLSLEEVALATSSTLGAVKQKAHRAYQGLRNALEHSHLSTPSRKGVGK